MPSAPCVGLTTSLLLPRPPGQRSVPALLESSPWGGKEGVPAEPPVPGVGMGCPCHRAGSVLLPRLSQRATRLGAVFALLEQRVTAGRASVASSRGGTGERCPACRVSALPSGVMSRHPRAAPIWALNHRQPSEPQKPLRGAGSWMDRQTDVSSGMGGDGDSSLSPSWEVEAVMKSCGDRHLGTHPAAHQQDLPQIRFFFTKNLSFCRAPDPRPASPPPPA